MHFAGKDDCNCVICVELNGGDKHTCVSGDGEEKIIVVEQPKIDRNLPFTYFGMEVNTFGSNYVVNYFSQEESSLVTISRDDYSNESDKKIDKKETQQVSVELPSEELDEDFFLEFLENNVCNVVYKRTFAYASKLLHELQHEFYCEEDPPLYFYEEDGESSVENHR